MNFSHELVERIKDAADRLEREAAELRRVVEHLEGGFDTGDREATPPPPPSGRSAPSNGGHVRAEACPLQRMSGAAALPEHTGEKSDQESQQVPGVPQRRERHEESPKPGQAQAGAPERRRQEAPPSNPENGALQRLSGAAGLHQSAQALPRSKNQPMLAMPGRPRQDQNAAPPEHQEVHQPAEVEVCLARRRGIKRRRSVFA